jgi:hypothetical protein
MSDINAKWRLKSKTEIDDCTGNPLYWSNEYGWTDKEDSDIFSDKEREDCSQHTEMVMDALWVREL